MPVSSLRQRQQLAQTAADYLTGTSFQHVVAALRDCRPRRHCGFSMCPVCSGRAEDRFTNRRIDQLRSQFDADYFRFFDLHPIFVTFTLQDVYSGHVGAVVRVFSEARESLFRPQALQSRGYLSAIHISSDGTDFHVHEHMVVLASAANREVIADSLPARFHEVLQGRQLLETAGLIQGYVPNVLVSQRPHEQPEGTEADPLADILRETQYALKRPSVETYRSMLQTRQTYLNLVNGLESCKLINAAGFFLAGNLAVPELIQVVD